MEIQASFRLGNDVRVVGRWARLILGVVIIVDLAGELIALALPPTFYLQSGLYFAGIFLVYLAAFYFLGERLLARANPWVGTFLLVVPAVAALFLDFLPSAFRLALLLYIGISLILNFAMSYGGCEVLAIPTFIFRRRYTVYCPSTVVDLIENAIAAGRHGQQSS